VVAGNAYLLKKKQ
jgi:hypothetical protein